MQHAVHGKTWHERVTFLTDAQTVCAEVVQPDENTKMVSHILDVFDGTNVIQVVGEGLNTPTKGTLRRDVKEKLSFSAAGPVRPMFLFAAPITQIFTPENTTISEVPDNTIILECLLPYKYPMLGRMTVSKQHWSPTDLVTSNLGSKRVHTHFVLDNYHEYAEGIWFPSHILEMNTSEAGSKTSDSEYRLVKLHLNTQVDTAPLHPPVPPGTNIADFRFGNDTSIRTPRALHRQHFFIVA